MLDGRVSADRERAAGLLRRYERLRRLRAHMTLLRAAVWKFAPAIIITAVICLPAPLVMAVQFPDAWICLAVTCVGVALPASLFVLSPGFMLNSRGWAAARDDAAAREGRRVPEIEMFVPRADAGVTRAHYRGTAHGEERLRSPLSGTPCLAWRLAGVGPAGAIDEAMLSDFELRAGDGAVRVVGGPGAVGLSVAGASRVSAPCELRALLDTYFAFAELGDVHVREAVLRSGASVRVEGCETQELPPEGYRAQRATVVLRDAPGSPLVVTSG